ncbi:MAG: hypothetical protein NDI90_02415 [Nitrospira sp. BO4]|jgi:hypothetical protein|nr:hypothetical protein [Nitrospira sp. BO4]
MRGVRFPLPKQAHRIHVTIRDQERQARPQSRALLACWEADRDDETETVVHLRRPQHHRLKRF